MAHCDDPTSPPIVDAKPKPGNSDPSENQPIPRIHPFCYSPKGQGSSTYTGHRYTNILLSSLFGVHKYQ